MRQVQAELCGRVAGIEDPSGWCRLRMMEPRQLGVEVRGAGASDHTARMRRGQGHGGGPAPARGDPATRDPAIEVGLRQQGG